jgi:adenylate cyclase
MTTNPNRISQIEAQLKKIQDSNAFGEATKLKKFLSYVVGKYCDGSTDDIKQYTIGVEAFSMEEDFDPQQDPIIRIMAGKVRRRLAEYYSSEGIEDQLLIEIPKGSYVPKISSKTAEDDDRGGKLTSVSQSAAHNLKIAVVPFHNISGDKDLDYFADGLAEEITSVLSLYKDFSIVPPIATRSMAGPQLNLMEIATQFEARYVLDTSIRKANDQVRIIVKLSDTNDFSLIWTSTYDIVFDVENLFNIQDEITSNVTNSIANEYGGTIPRKVASESTTNGKVSLTTYEASLHIHHYNLSLKPALIYDETLDAIDSALESDPLNPMLLSALAELKLDGYALSWSDANELPSKECQKLLDKATKSDPDLAYPYFVLGLLRTNQRDRLILMEVIEKLLSFKHNIVAQVHGGWFLVLAGKYDEGLKLLDKHLPTLKYYPGWIRHGYFLFHYQNGRYEDALAEASRINMPGLLWDPVDRAAALGQLGRYQEGDSAIQELVAMYPTFFDNPKRFLEMYIMDDDLLDKVIKGLELSRK